MFEVVSAYLIPTCAPFLLFPASPSSELMRGLARPHSYFSQVESLLRRSLGVSASASARDTDSIKPAPPIEVGPIRAADPDFDPSKATEANVPKYENPEEWSNWQDMKEGLDKEKKEKAGVKAEAHDEL